MKLALRSLLRAPGFTAVAILILSLGIGLTASTFSMTNAFLLRDVPYPRASELMRFHGTSRQSQTNGLAPGTAYALRDTATSFSAVAHYSFDSFLVGEPGEPAEQVQGMVIGDNFLSLLGVQPLLGRGFVPADSKPDFAQAAIITQREWIRRYAADPAVIGRIVRLNTRPITIVGVLPASFDAPLVWGPIDVIIPRTGEAKLRLDFHSTWMQAVGRLKPGVSSRQAQGELSTLAARLTLAHPKDLTGVGLRSTTLHDSNMDATSRGLLWLMTLLSLTMLLIACANLASLQVARAFGRTREFAVRAALGGSRRQLMVPLLVESILLSFAGGLGGLLVATWSNDLLSRLLVVNNEPGYAIPLDGNVLAFAAAVSLVSGLAFGLAPAWLASRTSASAALNQSSRGATASRAQQRLKSILIVGELALAVALVGLAAAYGVGAKSFMKRPVGWTPDGLFNGFIALPTNPYSDEGKQRLFASTLLDRLQKIPGVDQAALTTSLPIFGLSGPLPLVVEGQPVPPPGQEPTTEAARVSADYFSVLRLPLKEGAFFSAGLTEKDPLVAVVNESFARQFWPGRSAIGRRIKVANGDQWLEIIGVVGDAQGIVRVDTPTTRLQLYRPLVQAPTRYFLMTLRTPLDPASLTPAVRAVVASLDTNLAVVRAESVRTTANRSLANLDLIIINLSISAGMGLLIAAIGLFGVISQLTYQRTRDIGVRMALGAQSLDIVRLILRQGAGLLLLGLILGIPGYYAFATILQRIMPEMALPGLWLLSLNLAVLSVVMLLACYLPARRATRIDPITALRSE